MNVVSTAVNPATRDSLLKGRIGTVDLHALTSSDQLLLILKKIFVYFLTEKPTFIRRSTVHKLPLQKGFPVATVILFA
jgi:hypothetical protein